MSSDGIFVQNDGYSGNKYLFFTNTDGLIGSDRTFSAVDAACFFEGAVISCVDGDRTVESLRIGDAVRLAHGGSATIRWIGRDRRAAAFTDPMRAMPVRIAAGALGENLPARDLCLSPDHAVFIDDVLVQAGTLVNGTTVTRMTPEETGEVFTYFHIELEEHALIIADGMPAESFVANVGRGKFENFAEYTALYGEERFIEEMPYPRAQSWRQVPAALKARLAAKAAA